VCAQCAGETDCHADPHCVNCGGHHTCYSKDCPEWLDKKRSQELKFERNISFGEAKQIVDRQAVPGATSAVRIGTSYAKTTVSATSQATQSVEIQTDFTWPRDCKYPILCSCATQPLTGGCSGGLVRQPLWHRRFRWTVFLWRLVDTYWRRWTSEPLKQATSRRDQQKSNLWIKDLDQYLMCR